MTTENHEGSAHTFATIASFALIFPRKHADALYVFKPNTMRWCGYNLGIHS
jgi:hypothetical protein